MPYVGEQKLPAKKAKALKENAKLFPTFRNYLFLDIVFYQILSFVLSSFDLTDYSVNQFHATHKFFCWQCQWIWFGNV